MRWAVNAPCWLWILKALICSVLAENIPYFSVLVPHHFEYAATCTLSLFNNPKTTEHHDVSWWVGCSIDGQVCKPKFHVCNSFNTLWPVIKWLYNRKFTLRLKHFTLLKAHMSWSEWLGCLYLIFHITFRCSLLKIPAHIIKLFIFFENATYSSFVARYETAEFVKTACICPEVFTAYTFNF